jgi:hypothetical protein
LLLTPSWSITTMIHSRSSLLVSLLLHAEPLRSPAAQATGASGPFFSRLCTSLLDRYLMAASPIDSNLDLGSYCQLEDVHGLGKTVTHDHSSNKSSSGASAACGSTSSATSSTDRACEPPQVASERLSVQGSVYGRSRAHKQQCGLKLSQDNALV